ncbi:MAG: exodeoxyribonuclease VII small subunit [Lentisphaerae bacterium]|nr:exodeoxyribonuclease VII small subunit [Lentisphaerota bacterium]
MSAKKSGGAKAEDGAGQPSFEGAMQRLETIVAEMEDGKLNLEDMIARFEEGQKLIGFCTAKLNEVEKKVEMLVKRGESVTLEPFPETEDEAEDSRTDARAQEKDELF